MYRRAERAMLAIAMFLAVVFTLYSFQAPLYRWYTQIDTHFDPRRVPAAPDYGNANSWAALPDRRDQADVAPPDSGMRDGQAQASVDVFYVHPTSAVLSRRVNAAIDDAVTNAITDHGVIAWQASAFNDVARIYAPRYRQLTMAAQQSAIGAADRAQAMAVARADVFAAFDYYMAHFNRGRPLIIASHSQGSQLTPALLARYFAPGKPYRKQLVAAYLIGAHLRENQLQQIGIPLCASAAQAGCFVSWDSVLEKSELAAENTASAGGKILCVNPLSWRVDNEKVGAAENRGSLPMTGVFGLRPLIAGLFGAQCAANGYLMVNDSDNAGFRRLRFAGGSMHTYDYGLFYATIRQNARERARAFSNQGAAVLPP